MPKFYMNFINLTDGTLLLVMGYILNASVHQQLYAYPISGEEYTKNGTFPAEIERTKSLLINSLIHNSVR